MAVHHGGRGPGHLSRWPKAASGGTPTLQTYAEHTFLSFGAPVTARWEFSTPMIVGAYAGGQPYIISDRAATVTRITPDAVAVPGVWKKGGANIAASFMANGAMVNPYYDWYTGQPLGSQGFDGLLGEYADDAAITASTVSGNTTLTVSSIPAGTSVGIGQQITGTGISGSNYISSQLTGTAGGTGTYQLASAAASTVSGGSFTLSGGPSASACMTYDPALNVDPAVSGPYAIGIGDSKSIVKSIRRAALTMPGAWRTFDAWAVLHIVPTAPPAGALPPSASGTDKTTTRTIHNWNKAALGSGFTLPASMPSFATAEAAGYFSRGFQPYFGFAGEVRRRMMVLDYAPNDTGYSGNNGGFGMIWADWFAGLVSQGSSVADAYLIRALEFGSQMDGLSQRGHTIMGGAGQYLGHKMFAQLYGHVFHDAMPSMLTIRGNTTDQPFWVKSEQVGMATMGFGVLASNHNVNRGTFYPEHVGKPMWYGESEDYADMRFETDHDSNLDSDYQQVSSQAMLAELANICALRAGPGGADGFTALLNGGPNDATNERAAAINYGDRLRTFPTNVWVLDPYQQRHADLWDTVRGSSAVPRYQGTPDPFVPYKNQSTYLFAISGGFQWNLSSIDLDTETRTQWDLRYSLDQRSWTVVNNCGATGSVTSLPAGVQFYVQFRGRSASGTGPWGVNYAYKYSGSGLEIAERMVATTTGTPSGTATNTVAASIAQKLYPAWEGPEFVAADTAQPVGKALYAAKGSWTGNITGAWSFQWNRDGVAISGATADSYTTVSADLGTVITCTITQGAVSVTTAGVGVPNLAFADTIDQPKNTLTSSGTITLAGIVGTQPITVTGGEYRINGGSWVSSAGTVVNGDTLQLRDTSANSSGGLETVTVAIGAVSTIWRLYSVYDAFPVVRFDGTNDGLLRSSAFTGEADGKAFTFAALIEMKGGDGATQVLFDLGPNTTSAQSRLRITRISTTNLIQTLARNSSATTILSRNSTTALTVASGLKRVMISCDLAAGTYQVYFDDTNVSPGSGTLTDDFIDLGDGASSLEAIGMTVAQASKLNANLTYLWFDPTFIDLSVSGNRDTFLPANIGSTGLGPLGAAPMVFMLGNAAAYADGTAQKGTGGAFTQIGALDDA